MTIKELFEYMKHGTDEQNEEALAVLDDVMLAIKKNFPTTYKKYEHRLEQAYKHYPLDPEEAKEYVAGMDNKDGSHGEHWTLAQVESYMASKPEYNDLDPVCFYVALNMMYSDYYTPTKSVDSYAQMAASFLRDKDAPADKMQRYMKAMRD